MTSEAVITHVDSLICRACGECEKTCGFKAIKVEEKKDGKQLASVTASQCTGCGACNVACPTGAARLAHFQDEQVCAIIDSIF